MASLASAKGLPMNEAHLHLILNHVPVVGFLFVIALLALAWLRDSEELRRIALGSVVVTGILSLPVYFSGEPAEEIVEDLSGVSELAIEDHEEMAEGATVVAAVTALLAALAMVIGVRRGVTPRWSVGVVTVCGIVAAIWLGYAASLGGRIRHPEIDSVTPGPGGPERDD